MRQRESLEPVIRLLRSSDSVAELTLLLHRAYADLAGRGMRFLASHQNEDRTRERISRGQSYLAIHEQRTIGTITWCDARQTHGSPWYDRSDVASFGQFAVEPLFQGRGIGSRLMAMAEQRSVLDGAAELALDTAETAHDLIHFYSERGYRFVEYVQWNEVNYRSVILSKPIARR